MRVHKPSAYTHNNGNDQYQIRVLTEALKVNESKHLQNDRSLRTSKQNVKTHGFSESSKYPSR